LTPSTLYHYRVKSKDAAGNLATSGDFTFTTAAPDVTPPVISNVTSSNITATAARITWTTDENSDSQVNYGLTNTYGNSTTLNTTLVTAHTVNLSGLTASTLYHYRVNSKDASGNLATSGDFTFTTAAPDTTPPAVPQGLKSTPGDSKVDLKWTANTEPDLAGYNVYESLSPGGTFAKLNTSLLTSVSYTQTNLVNGVAYWYQITAVDTSGNESGFSSLVSATPIAAVSNNSPSNSPASLTRSINIVKGNSPARLIYHLDEAGQVKIRVYNRNGELVDELINGDQMAGDHEADWDGENSNGERIASTIYYVNIEEDNHLISKIKVPVVR